MTLADGAMILLGGALFCVAILIVPRALWRDRARGRRRCPRCWYAMEGARGDASGTLVCPECGFEARSARTLLRTRRRWRLAVVGVLLGATGIGLGTRPLWRGVDWLGMTPSWLLARVTPVDPTMWSMGRLQSELFRRAGAGELPVDAVRVYLRRTIAAHPEILRDAVHSRSAWPVSEAVWVCGKQRSELGLVVAALLGGKSRFEIRWERAAGGGPGAWVGPAAPWQESPVSIGAPLDAAARLEGRIRADERELWRGTFSPAFEIREDPDTVLAPLRDAGLDDAIMKALISEWTIVQLDDRDEIWEFGLGWRPSRFQNVAIGAFVEFVMDGEIVATGELLVSSSYWHSSHKLGEVRWVGERPSWDDWAASSRTVVLRSSRTLALRAINWTPEIRVVGEVEPTRYWEGALNVPLPRIERDGDGPGG